MYGSPGMEDGSYAVAVGSEGEFTGICSYGNGVCCWKENILHKMLGDSPSSYYMNTYRVAGVQKGCDKSLVVNNEVLYYKGVYGVYAYTGGTPSLISYKLGDMPMTDAVGGTDSLIYYLGLKDRDDNNVLYAYDIIRGLWIKTDNIPIEAFTTIGHTVYALSESKVYRLNDGDEKVEWSLEFAPFIEQEFSKSGYTKLLLRLDMEKGSWLKVFTKQDNSIYRPAYHKAANSQDVTISIPLKIGRCDRFQLKLEGYGKVKIYSIAREFSKGSEV